MFRGLRPDEIDVRVGSVSAKGVSLLLYKGCTLRYEYFRRDIRLQGGKESMKL